MENPIEILLKEISAEIGVPAQYCFYGLPITVGAAFYENQNYMVSIRDNKIYLDIYKEHEYNPEGTKRCVKAFIWELAEPGVIERIIDILKAAIHG